MKYAIWGVVPGTKTEDLLCETVNGEYISTTSLAAYLVKHFTDKGCKDCRIQSIDLTRPYNAAQTFVQCIDI